jgi:hypothetical protein
MPRLTLIIKSAFASGAALLVAAVFAASPALAASSVVIANNDPHKTLVATDIDGTNPLTIAYQKNSYSYLKWSTDGGQTFSSPRILNAGNKALNPRLAVCGDGLWAASVWPTNAGTDVGLDFVDLSSNHLSDHWWLQRGGYGPDVACLSYAEPDRPLEKTVGVVWLTNEGGAVVEINDWTCADGCNTSYGFIGDLGRAQANEGIKIAAVDDGFVVTWVPRSGGLKVQHFEAVRSGGNLIVTPGPVLHLMSRQKVHGPVIDADGSRVVIAYELNDAIAMRISDNSGATFGARDFVSRLCTTGNCFFPRPTSVSARNGQILVEVKYSGGDPPGFETDGRLTSNDGAKWRTISSWSGSQIGELLNGTAAEARDKHDYTDPIYGNVPQQITFTNTPLN